MSTDDGASRVPFVKEVIVLSNKNTLIIASELSPKGDAHSSSSFPPPTTNPGLSPLSSK